MQYLDMPLTSYLKYPQWRLWITSSYGLRQASFLTFSSSKILCTSILQLSHYIAVITFLLWISFLELQCCLYRYQVFTESYKNCMKETVTKWSVGSTTFCLWFVGMFIHKIHIFYAHNVKYERYTRLDRFVRIDFWVWSKRFRRWNRF